MQLDKKIREGLVRQAAAAVTSHPDPDQLTAFVEQALSQPERQQVLQHLSLCTDCREVVALSLPEVEAVPVVATQPETSIWQRWLVMRWAAAAAAVVVVAGAVTLYQTNQPRQRMAAIVDGQAYIDSLKPKTRRAESPKTEAKTEATAQANEAGSVPVASSAAKKSDETKPSEPVMMASANQPNASGTKEKALSVPISRSDEPTVAKTASAPATPPPVNAVAAMQSPNLKTTADVAQLDRPVEVRGGTLAGAGASGGAAFPSGTGRALRESGDQPVQTYDQGGSFTVAHNQDVTPKRGFGVGRDEIAKTLARRPMTVGMFGTAAPMPNAPTLAHGWSVTTDGLLKRSHGLNDSHTVRVADGVFFKAVAESGTEVWAGGIGGALYHSIDDGRNWMKVMPSAGDQPLIADIVAIHASQRGTAELSASNGERWITVDGGQSWTRHQ